MFAQKSLTLWQICTLRIVCTYNSSGKIDFARCKYQNPAAPSSSGQWQRPELSWFLPQSTPKAFSRPHSLAFSVASLIFGALGKSIEKGLKQELFCLSIFVGDPVCTWVFSTCPKGRFKFLEINIVSTNSVNMWNMFNLLIFLCGWASFCRILLESRATLRLLQYVASLLNLRLTVTKLILSKYSAIYCWLINSRKVFTNYLAWEDWETLIQVL